MEKASDMEVIKDTIKAIEDNTELFYQQKNNEGYKMLNTTLALLEQTINAIQVSEYIDGQLFIEVLTEAMKALENGDTILFSDILYFNLKSLLEQNIQ